MSMDHPSSVHFPVPHKKLSVDIKPELMSIEGAPSVRSDDFGAFAYEAFGKPKIPGNKTDVVICSYNDHFLVVVTQIGTMGTILHARKEEGVSVHPTFSVSVIFGKRDEPMLEACARQLIENISSSSSSKPLVLSLGLKDHSMDTLKGIVSAVVESRLW